MIVADANLLAYLCIPTELQTKQAEYVRSREKVWIAPPLLRHEFLHVIARYIARGDFDVDEAARVYQRGISMMEFSTLPLDAHAIFRITQGSGCTTYDAEYVWLAREMNIPLVTADKEVLAAFPSIAIAIETFD